MTRNEAIEQDVDLLDLAFKHIREAVRNGNMTIEDGCRRSVDAFFIHHRNVKLIKATYGEGGES